MLKWGESFLALKAENLLSQMNIVTTVGRGLSQNKLLTDHIAQYQTLLSYQAREDFANVFPCYTFEKLCNTLSHSSSLNFTLIMPDGRILNNNAPTLDNPYISLVHTDWYQKVSATDSFSWVQNPILDYIINAPAPCIHCLCQLPAEGCQTGPAVLVLSIPDVSFSAYYNRQIEKYQSIYLVDENYNIVSEIDNGHYGNSLSPIFRQITKSPAGTRIEKIDDDCVFISYNTISTLNWRMISVCDYRSAMQNHQAPFLGDLLFSLCPVILCLLFFCLLRRTLILPLEHLGKRADSILRERDNTAADSVTNEFTAIGTAADSLLAETAQLKETIRREKALKEMSDLKAFELQINPHFIYNTLASIRFLVLSHLPEKADKAIISLIKYLRGMLSSRQPYLTITEECANLQDYIDIQQLVFDSRLSYTCEVDGEISTTLIARSLLQPLLENAILHGLSPKPLDWKLSLRIQPYQEQGIRVCIQDNGVGFDTSILDDNAGSRHIGIQNIRRRIQLAYGAPYGFTVESEIGVGTTCILFLPRIDSNHENTDC